MPDDILVKLSKNVRRYRLRQDLTQVELAKKIKRHPGYVSRLENGKVNIFVCQLFKLAKVLKVKAKDLVK